MKHDLNEIVSLLQHKDRIIVATKQAIFDITDANNPLPLTNMEELDKCQMGYKYEVTAYKAEV